MSYNYAHNKVIILWLGNNYINCRVLYTHARGTAVKKNGREQYTLLSDVVFLIDPPDSLVCLICICGGQASTNELLWNSLLC